MIFSIDRFLIEIPTTSSLYLRRFKRNYLLDINNMSIETLKKKIMLSFIDFIFSRINMVKRRKFGIQIIFFSSFWLMFILPNETWIKFIYLYWIYNLVLFYNICEYILEILIISEQDISNTNISHPKRYQFVEISKLFVHSSCRVNIIIPSNYIF